MIRGIPYPEEQLAQLIPVSEKDWSKIRWNDKDALQISAFVKNYSMLQHLLDLGARPDSVSKEWGSALHIAIRNRATSQVDFLSDNCAESDKPLADFSGRTALHCAIVQGTSEITEILIQKGWVL